MTIEPSRRARRPLAALLGIVALGLVACGRGGSSSAESAAAAPVRASGAESAAATPARAAASGPPVSVTVAVARRRDMPVLLQATGTVAPVSSVDVRPQVTSVVTQVHVREGQFVRAGQPLFMLDARADEANVAKLRAQMAKDEAALADAERQLTRSRELLAQNFISQGAVDSNQTLVASAAAVVAADRAALEAARLTLGYARVLAPGGGRVGVINAFVGTSVVANQTTLVTITQLDPIDVAFSVPQRDLPDVLVALRAGAAVSATLPDGSTRIVGRLRFVDNAIDAASGTIKAKARFDNREQRLWPGAFVGAALTLRTLKDSVVIPMAAIAQTARGTIVYAVLGGKAVPRPVEVVAALGEDAAVTGVGAGERIVLEGRQNLRPGAPVAERAAENGRRPTGGPAGARAASAARTGNPAGPASGAAP